MKSPLLLTTLLATALLAGCAQQPKSLYYWAVSYTHLRAHET